MDDAKITNQEHMAKATGRSLPISPKQSVEICNFIRNKNLQRAKKILDDVILEKIPVPYKRYNRSIGHKTGKLSVGRYPIKACKQILSILKSAESNAQTKGLNTSNLVITSLIANKGSKQYRYGRQRGRRMKRTHIEVVLEEKETGSQTKSDSSQ
ncbi:50S ribosomal protein L22, partial [Candidatus Woesearchaeota archaeon]|nr:50S ribosomal protein L22 [Candidatus Woesearchaeota archaeon]